MKVCVLGFFVLVTVTFLESSVFDVSRIKALLHENINFSDGFTPSLTADPSSSLDVYKDTEYSGTVSSLTLFVGGIADKYEEYGYGPTNFIAYSKHIFDVNSADQAISAYFGYNERELIVATVLDALAISPNIKINIVGHLEGGAIGIDIASNEFNDMGISLNLLISLDPVAVPGVRKIDQLLQSDFYNVNTFVNIYAVSNETEFDVSDTQTHEKYGMSVSHFTTLFNRVVEESENATALLFSPLGLDSNPQLTPFDMLIDEVNR